ncbi:helix-turn-helix domain-containing protein [Sphingomonas montanisoli]|uniref:helix-turn-helix domain-containing protein n=1 Tax=Sphingomonas montanisoli TaxID=2606412 RepID=UPI0015E19365|nr:helix-turn-helix domain-containing protein [Sphingomonas montanisoli]
MASLLTTAEALFGQRGIENVSLREIATAAGSRNNNLVQYHFGTKEGLTAAIFRSRIQQMDVRRAQMLSIAEAAGLVGDLPTLLEIICLPQFDIANLTGHHPYPSFLLQYARLYWRVGGGPDWTRDGVIAPALHRTNLAMIAALTPLPRDVARLRMQLCHFMFLEALIRWDQIDVSERVQHQILLTDTLRAAQAALVAGCPASTRLASPFVDIFPMLAL